MQYGYQRMALYPFVTVGFVVVMAVGIALAFVYLVGRVGGRRAAGMFTNACMLVVLGGLSLDLAWAFVSGQWEGFMRDFGLAPLFEMAVLAAMFVLSMWWMAVRYVADTTHWESSDA